MFDNQNSPLNFLHICRAYQSMRSELSVECREIVLGRAKDSTCAREKPVAGQISKSRKPGKQIVFLTYPNISKMFTGKTRSRPNIKISQTYKTNSSSFFQIKLLLFRCDQIGENCFFQMDLRQAFSITMIGFVELLEINSKKY